MSVRVKNSTTGAGSNSGKKPVCVQVALEERIACNFTFTLQLETVCSLKRLPHYAAS